MSEFALYENIMLLGSGIEACIEKKLSSPALILIYSAIDIVGWLDSNNEYANQTSFIKWVDAYLLKAKSLECTALDLYAARCGLVHTFSSDSHLTSKRKARRIYYAWGTANVQHLQRTIELMKKSKELVAVHVNDLYEGWQLGVLKFIEELEKDRERKLRVFEKATKFFSELGLETLPKILDKIDKDEDASGILQID
jgi:hypothetical protein